MPANKKFGFLVKNTVILCRNNADQVFPVRLLHQKYPVPSTKFNSQFSFFSDLIAVFEKIIFIFLMYDIAQLNDMLVPELQDIAEQLTIANFKELDKQDIIDKILKSRLYFFNDMLHR